MAQITLKNIHKSFGNTEVIHGVDLDIASGEFMVFVGPSGCGKSTMLRMISGLEDVTEGQVFIDNKDVTQLHPSKRELAMVFQSYALFPHMNVAENIGFGLGLAGTNKADIDQRVKEVAQTLQLENLLDRKPRQLSGGQRQRVAIGRSIARNPKVFLFDEPLSNLDAALRVKMRLEIARLHKTLKNVTMIYVTHDQVEAMTLADRIVVFNEGRVEQVGTPMELYQRPANQFVAGFIGAPAMNFFKRQPDQQTPLMFGRHQLEVPDNHEPNQPLTLGVRPEHVQLCEESEADFRCEVEYLEQLGAETLIYAQADALNNEAITIRTAAHVDLQAGDEVFVAVEAADVHVFVG